MIEFNRETLADLDKAQTLEWLETNGLGGYASSTVVGLNTRRYHGLLVAALKPPVGRSVLLSKLAESIAFENEHFELDVNHYPGAVHPTGHLHLEAFRSEPVPTFVYRVGHMTLEKSLFMVHGSSTTVIGYRLVGRGRETASLEIKPIVAGRDYHALGASRVLSSSDVTYEPGSITIRGLDGATLYLAHDGEVADEVAVTYRNAEYREERERGFDHREDLWSPCSIRIELTANADVYVVASTEPQSVADAPLLRAKEEHRRASIESAGSQRLIGALTRAAQHYVVQRGERETVIAGYHWFGDWGRDTMISLPGLTLVTGRFDEARAILSEFAAHVARGLLPNRFPDGGELPEYNTVDSSLWYFEAVRSFLKYTVDYEFVRNHIFPALCSIVEWHLRGTRYGIRVDDDGLLCAGEPGVQLTWMDAKVGDRVITPRHGKPVEIQALWYNALRILEDLASRFDEPVIALRCAVVAERARESFNELFWNDEAACLYDVVAGELVDASIRPNQVLAVSLHHSMLDPGRARAVVATVERELLTPVGLRSLSINHPDYCPKYEGDGPTRDAAYHQGTVWAWLLGPFVSAYVRVNGTSAAAHASGLLEGIEAHLREGCVGHVSEIFDSDPPHRARGCVAQAWSVAEILRAAHEDVYGARENEDIDGSGTRHQMEVSRS